MSKFNLNIKATNMELTSELKQHIDTQLQHVEKYFSFKPDEQIIVEFEIEKVTGEHHKHGHIFRSEINLTDKGNLFRVEETEEDIFTAIDNSCDEMSRTVKRKKEKKIDMVRRGGKAIKKFLRFGRE